jgi:hypothetical protein
MTEAGGGSPTAIDRNEEQPVTPPLIGRIDRASITTLPAEKNPILDGKRRQVTASHSDHRKRPLRRRGSALLPRPFHPLEPGDRLPRWKEKVLQGMGPDNMIERAGRFVAVEPIVPPLLLVEPAGGEVVGRGQIAEHDRPIGHRGADDTIFEGENLDEPLKRLRPEDHPVTDLWDGRRQGY